MQDVLDLADCYAYDTGYKSTQCSNKENKKKIWRLKASQSPEKNVCLLVCFFLHYLEILGNSFSSVKVKRNSLFPYEILYKEVQKIVFDSLLFRNELISTRYCVLLIAKKDFDKIRNAAFRSTVQRSIQYLYITISNQHRLVHS